MFQIIEQTQFGFKLLRTTLEEATDVTYEQDDINELYNGGEQAAKSWCGKNHLLDNKSNIMDVCNNTYLFVKEIVRYVNERLDQTKVVEVPFGYGDVTPVRLFDARFIFFQYGLTYSKVRGGFEKYKVPKVKPVSVSKQLLAELRQITVCRINTILNERYGVELDIKNVAKKTVQSGFVRMFCDLGGTTQNLIDYEKFYYAGGTRGFLTLIECINHKESDKDLANATYKEWYNWFVGCKEIN